MTEHANLYHKKRYSTLFSLIFNTTFKLLLLSFLAWIFLLMIFFVMAFHKGVYVSEQAIYHLLNSSSAWLADKDFSAGKILISMIRKTDVQIQSNLSYGLDFILLRLEKFNLGALVNLQSIAAIVMIIIKTIQVILIRLFIFILSFSLWLSWLFVMIVDGLVQHEIRKYQAARESTFLFHRLKLLTENLFYSFFLIYMSIPMTIQPELILLPMVIMVSMLIMLSIKYYKKYV